MTRGITHESLLAANTKVEFHSITTMQIAGLHYTEVLANGVTFPNILMG